LKGVRGNKGFKTGIHYFEIKCNESLYGTSVMFGIGTESIRLHYENYDYVNLIGKDDKSWGLCHIGTIHHNNIKKEFCEPFFDKDSTIGMLIDLYQGTLHYFLNKKYLGIAFTGIFPRETIYPIISSTATDIELELQNTFSYIYSLQDLCCNSIRNIIPNENFDLLPITKHLIDYLKQF
jgi:SPRY domain-containing SOCS box protein 3